MAKAEQLSAGKMFGGWNKKYKHQSDTLGCSMTFTVYYPPAAEKGKVPILYFLAGLTCTDDNMIQKSGAQRKASALGIALIAPDTSPRGLDTPGSKDSWDFGEGAGFYLNATQPGWEKWRMYEYITTELPQVLLQFPELDTKKAGISGHSMGGHGALTLGLKNPDKYSSISAFAPISNPSQVPWGQKAFKGYLGDDKSLWKQYDATEVAKEYEGPEREILVDQGTADNFLKEQLDPTAFKSATDGNPKITLNHRMQEGYDHSYYLMSTFFDDHVEHAAKHLAKL